MNIQKVKNVVANTLNLKLNSNLIYYSPQKMCLIEITITMRYLIYFAFKFLLT